MTRSVTSSGIAITRGFVVEVVVLLARLWERLRQLISVPYASGHDVLTVRVLIVSYHR